MPSCCLSVEVIAIYREARKPTVMVTNLPSYCFRFTSFYEGSPPKQNILRTSREKRAQGRLLAKYRQHKHFLSSVDVKKFHRPREVPKRKHWWCATSLELSSALHLCEGAKKTVENNNMCAKLRMSVCGTKAAAQNWQKKVQETMATLGFSSGKALLILFCHHQRG